MIVSFGRNHTSACYCNTLHGQGIVGPSLRASNLSSLSHRMGIVNRCSVREERFWLAPKAQQAARYTNRHLFAIGKGKKLELEVEIEMFCRECEICPCNLFMQTQAKMDTSGGRMGN